MSNAQEAVKTRHKETSLIFPVLALVVLFLWGSSQTLPVVIAINLLALIGILSSAFSVVRHADVLAHRLGILGMRRKHVLYAFRQIAFRFIRHR